MLPALLLALLIIFLFVILLIIFMGSTPGQRNLNDPCMTNDNCAPGLSCVGGFCKSELGQRCLNITDCTDDATACSNGRCVALPLGGPGQPGPCQTGLALQRNMCVGMAGSSCTGDALCFGSLKCIQGVCAQDNGAGAGLPPLAAPTPKIKKPEVLPPPPVDEPYTLIQLNGMKDLLVEAKDFSVASATQYGKYIVVGNNQGELRVYDLMEQKIVPITIPEKLFSLTLTNGYITGLNAQGRVVQLQKEINRKDGGVEWRGVELGLEGRKLHASPDGHYLVVLTQFQCYIFDMTTNIVPEPVTSFAITEDVVDVIVNNDLSHKMIVNKKGIQINGEKFAPTHYGCFNSEGRFAVIPLKANFIIRTYIFNDESYCIIKRSDIPKLSN